MSDEKSKPGIFLDVSGVEKITYPSEDSTAILKTSDLETLSPVAAPRAEPTMKVSADLGWTPPEATDDPFAGAYDAYDEDSEIDSAGLNLGAIRLPSEEPTVEEEMADEAMELMGMAAVPSASPLEKKDTSDAMYEMKAPEVKKSLNAVVGGIQILENEFNPLAGALEEKTERLDLNATKPLGDKKGEAPPPTEAVVYEFGQQYQISGSLSGLSKVEALVGTAGAQVAPIATMIHVRQEQRIIKSAVFLLMLLPLGLFLEWQLNGGDSFLESSILPFFVEENLSATAVPVKPKKAASPKPEESPSRKDAKPPVVSGVEKQRNTIKNPYYNLGVNLSYEPIKPVRLLTAAEESEWRDDLLNPKPWRRLKAVEEIAELKLGGSDVFLWEALGDPKYWVRFTALMTLSDFGKKVPDSILKKTLLNVRHSLVLSTLKRFYHTKSPGQQLTLRRLLRYLPYEASRFFVLSEIAHHRHDTDTLIWLAAQEDASSRVRALARNMLSRTPNADLEAAHLELKRLRSIPEPREGEEDMLKIIGSAIPSHTKKWFFMSDLQIYPFDFQAFLSGDKEVEIPYEEKKLFEDAIYLDE